MRSPVTNSGMREKKIIALEWKINDQVDGTSFDEIITPGMETSNAGVTYEKKRTRTNWFGLSPPTAVPPGLRNGLTLWKWRFLRRVVQHYWLLTTVLVVFVIPPLNTQTCGGQFLRQVSSRNFHCSRSG